VPSPTLVRRAVPHLDSVGPTTATATAVWPSKHRPSSRWLTARRDKQRFTYVSDVTALRVTVWGAPTHAAADQGAA